MLDHGRCGCTAIEPAVLCAYCESPSLYVRQYNLLAGTDVGYLRICLDTLPTMTSAQQLYQSFGFAPIAPYGFNPIPGTQFLALDLNLR